MRVRYRTSWAESLRLPRRLSGHDQSISHAHVGILCGAGREFDGRKRAPRTGQPPRADVRSHADDEALTIGKDDVDGEPHAERVDGLTGCDDQRGAFGEAVASE